MNTISLSEFNNVTKEDWLKQTIKDLKGKDFDETLLWKLPEGFHIQPYYAAEDLDLAKITEIQKAQQTKAGLGWQNRCKIKYSDDKITNLLIINALQAGADAVELNLNEAELSEINFVKLLHGIKLSENPIYFQTNQPQKVLEALKKFVNYQPKGGLINDFVADLLTGKSDSITDSAWHNLQKNIRETLDYQQFKVISISSHPFHEAGANTVQELAFTLNSAILYLDKLTDLGLKMEEILPKIEFSVSIGTNYFFEIAKIRALRFLWQKIISNDEGVSAQTSSIHCQTSYFYDATSTPHTNMLRATTEAMSAVIGGCDALSIHAYNEVFEPSNDLSERIARNISTLLKEEAYLDKTKDAAAGSYYLENLTVMLVEKAWELLTEVEEKGGLLMIFENGFLNESIEKSFQDKKNALENGKVMVGVNQFRFDEKPIEKTKNDNHYSKNILPNRRLSESFEQS